MRAIKKWAIVLVMVIFCGNIEVYANESLINTRAVIGEDDRIIVQDTEIDPYRCIGYLETVFKDGSKIRGTGFLVGDLTVLTVAHNVYKAGTTVSKIMFYPGYNSLKEAADKTPFGSSIGSVVHIQAGYVKAATERERQKYDYAVIELEQPLGKKTGHISLGGYNTAFNEKVIFEKNVVIVGYPTGTNHYMVREKKKADTMDTNSYMVLTKADGTSGQDGGPMLQVYNGKYYAIAIFTNYTVEGKNAGRYITKGVYDFVKKYAR